MKELSVFIDESGDFGEVKEKPTYYLVTLVFHDRKYDITNQVKKLEESTKNAGFDFEYIHTGPVIRREGIFASLSIDDRRKLIYKMLNFTMGCVIAYETVVVNRKEANSKLELSKKLATRITKVIISNFEFFKKYKKVIVYYDNGQIELGSILNEVFSVHFANVEFRKVEPQKYRLLQVADFICSLELLRIKWTENRLSNSEKKFFYKPQELKKVFLKAIEKKRM